MTKGFSFELEKDENGKFVIRDDTSEKELDKFYRQKGGSIYFELDKYRFLDDAVIVCLEVAKQEKCKVNFRTRRAGLVSVTPEMNQTDALNALTCHILQKEKPEDVRTKKIEQSRAKEKAPESIGFEDFYFLNEETRADRIINFCDANDIYTSALLFHYCLAVEYAKSQRGSYEEQVKKGTEHFGLPEIITQENLPELRKKLVLSRDDPRVAKTQKTNLCSKIWGRLLSQKS